MGKARQHNKPGRPGYSVLRERQTSRPPTFPSQPALFFPLPIHTQVASRVSPLSLPLHRRKRQEKERNMTRLSVYTAALIVTVTSRSHSSDVLACASVSSSFFLRSTRRPPLTNTLTTSNGWMEDGPMIYPTRIKW